MIVVADTSPINYLILIGRLDLLPALFTNVVTTPAVMRELGHAHSPRAVREWATNPASWIEVIAPREIALPPNLDAGEREAISLAVQLSAPVILIDERVGAVAAVSLGIRPLGTLGVLEVAATKNLVSLPEALALLKATSFRVGSDLIRAALERDALRRNK
jgi:predicted nucleic acid-binding protein